MHHSKRMPAVLSWTLWLGLTLQSPAPAQQPPPQPAVRGNALTVPINGTQRVQMSTKQPIKTVINEKENVARVRPVQGDPTSLLITGLEPGMTHLTLTDATGVQESLDVIVQFDIDYLRTSLRQVVPTANIQPIPLASSTVALTGYVARIEDVDIAMRTASSVVGGPDRVISGLRVGGVMQVQLDVVIAQVSRTELRRMSFDFMDFGQHHVLASTVGGGFVIPSAAGGGAGGIGVPPLGAPTIPNSIGAPNGVPANLFLAVFNNKQSFFGLLQALRDEQLAKLLAEPRLTTLSGQPASFLSGGEQAIPVPAGLGQVGVQFEEFGTRLNFLPVVMGNGKIHLEIEPERSDLNPAFGTSINGTVVPGRTTQRVHASVEMEDGQTLVLGGLIEHTVVGSTTKTPIVGDIPFLGAAFSRKSYQETESELIVVVTPHLVDAMSCDQAPKVFPGQETRSPDDFELFLEGILEAPRGPRDVCHDHRYVPAYKNGPTAALFPCAGDGRCGANGCRPGEPCGSPCSSSGPANPATTNVKPAQAEDAMPRAGLSGAAVPQSPPLPSAAAAPVGDSRPTSLPANATGSGGANGQQ
jgi:pilus assembly protein CpaC